VWQVVTLFMQRVAQALIEHSTSGPFNGPLEAVWMGLYQPPTPNIGIHSTLANITEATYDGYARQPVVWYPPILSSSGPETLYGQDLNFSPTGSVTPNGITGIFLADALTAGNLLMAAVLPAPVPLNGPTTALVVEPVFQMGLGQIYGAPISKS
jgi:hypothetical protein